MPATIIIGAQWGDEGKGRAVDTFAANADIVARFSGGDNAFALYWVDLNVKPYRIVETLGTTGHSDQLRADGWAEPIRDKTGLVVDAYFSGTKLAWLLNQVPRLSSSRPMCLRKSGLPQ